MVERTNQKKRLSKAFRRRKLNMSGKAPVQ